LKKNNNQAVYKKQIKTKQKMKTTINFCTLLPGNFSNSGWLLFEKKQSTTMGNSRLCILHTYW